ncbi:diacylglycerol/lipid kinase family protein [Amnibacterium endophyticum]|uniref:Diacylglycerol/lipid kinase family protein n=1 Tax=Amnibacterium endophyticum TaxID=2109337 RepID=A0ABW4LI12_9MICO
MDASQRRTAVLVVNPGSRQGGALLEDAEGRFARAGLELVGVRETEGDPREAVGRAIGDGPDVVVVAGGDGTISSATGCFAHRDAVLGIVPTGTTNNFARTLGLPLEADAALRTIAEGDVARIDLGLAGDQHFANVAAAGISVDIAQTVPRPLKRVLGSAAYALTGAVQLVRHRPMTARLRSAGGAVVARTHQVIVANGRFHAGRLIDERADADDDRLIVFQLGDRRRLRLLRSLVLLALERPRTVTDRNSRSVRRALLTTDPPLDLELDGEVRARTPVEISVDLEALQVVVPRGAAGPG